MRSQRGVALVQVLAAMAMPAIVVGGAAVPGIGGWAPVPVPALWIAQSSCAANYQALDKQPVILHASILSFSFEAECLPAELREQLAGAYGRGTLPMYFPASQWSASQSGFAHPASGYAIDGMPREVDTITFFFRPDLSTARPDDFMLLRQMNKQQPEVMKTSVVPYPGRPFFQYYYRELSEDGRQITKEVPTAWLPLQHAALAHGTAADTGAVAQIDVIRAVEINYGVSNGLQGNDERTQLVKTILPLADLSTKRGKPCNDDDRLFLQALMLTTMPTPRVSCASF